MNTGSQRIPSPSGLTVGPSGVMIGKYRILAEIGSGGMARVYLACSSGPAGFTKLVVLKVLKSEVLSEPDVVDMFLHEARLSGRLNHPNVVHTYEVFEEPNGLVMLVMEYLEGQTLHALLREASLAERRLPLALHVHVLGLALAGLHYAHELKDFNGQALGIVHRDVSPHNIFVTYDGLVKVLDFGIAKAITSHDTATGILKGKIAYMAPEQFDADSVDRRADIYAAGACLWHALTGERMWKGLRDPQVMFRVTKGQIPRPSSVDPDVDVFLEEVAMRALDKDPERRYATALELQADLRQYLDAAGASFTADKVGAYVAEHFQEARSKRRHLVEDKLASLTMEQPPRTSMAPAIVVAGPADEGAADAGEGADDPPPTVDLRTTGERPTRTTYTGDGTAVSAREVLESHESVAEAQGHTQVSATLVSAGLEDEWRRRMTLIGVFGAVLLLGATVVWLTLILTRPVTPNGPARAQGSEPSAVPSPLPSVTLTFHATPETARMTIDGAAVANPASTTVPMGSPRLKLRVEADGYVPKTTIVPTDKGGTVLIDLAEAGPAPSATPAPSAAPDAPAPVGPAPVATVIPSKQRPPATRPGPSRPAPAATPAPTGKATSAVPRTDNIDPWNKN